MDRVKPFGQNAGLRGVLLVIVVIFLVVQDIRSGLWIYTVPLLILMFLATYPFRGLLVEHLDSVRNAMNALVVVAIIASAALKASDFSESLWLTVAIVAFVGAYLSCYWWLLSDDRVVSIR